MNRRRRVLSLCSGAGGLDYGLEQAGWTVAAQAEVDPAASAVLAVRFPDVPNLGDVVTLAEDPQPLADLGPFGLLAAGFPCQDLSSAGRRRGLTAARSGLFFAVVAVARATRPSAILLENVPGLLSSGRTDPADGCVHSPQPAVADRTLFTVDDGGCGTGLPDGAVADGWDDHERGCPLPGADFGRVLGELTAAGYGDIAWRTVDSLHMGVPRRRRRVLLVAFPDGAGQARRVLCDPEGTPWQHPDRDTGPTTPAGLFDPVTVGRSPRRTAHLTDRLLDGRQPFVWSRSGFADGGWVWDADATDHPITAPAAVLADVLEPDPVPVRYYLSPTACAGGATPRRRTRPRSPRRPNRRAPRANRGRR